MIRPIVFISFLMHALVGVGQFTDDFTDGDFTSNPTWIGHTDRFVISSGELQLFAPAVQEESYLVTQSLGLDNGSWEFVVKMGFATSSTSLTKVYLMSTQQNLTGSLNGYFVLIGDSPDEISLFRQDGLSEVVLIDGVDKSIETSSVNVRINVTRDASGNWELFRDVTGGSTYTSEGTASDATYLLTSFFGIRCKYTATRSEDFFFDDFVISGTPILDTNPPVIVSASAISQNEVDILFDEPLDQTSAENSANYGLDLGVSVSDATLDITNPALVHLTTSVLTNGVTYTLVVNNVEDKNGNAIASPIQTEFTYLILSIASFRDVQINEFMTDPAPSLGVLPEVDFVELYNPTSNYYDLENWQIGDAVGQSGPMGSFVLVPNSYLIVCATSDVIDFQSFGNVIGVSSFPNFNSSTDDAVVLYDDASEVIDRVDYDGSDVPDDGITLEQINPNLECSGIFNFEPSLDELGGTPSAQNSVFMIVPDNFGPNLILANVISSDSLRFDFDEVINPETVQPGNFSFQPSFTIDIVYTLSEYPQSVFIKLTETVPANIPIEVSVTGIKDCSGNGVNSGTLSFLRGLEPEADDILLSEILFNPRPDGSDFVEIYNPSATESFELRGWRLAKLVDGVVSDEEPIAPDGLLISPKQFLVFTNDVNDIAIQYPQGNSEVYIELDQFPSYGNDEDTVVLVNPEGVVVQQFDYLEDYHYELLEDVDGVSLERVSYDQEVNDSNNWRSAASTVGFATPGRINSQSTDVGSAGGQLVIEPKVFLPGNTGSGRDFTTISYSFDQGGKFANIIIYDQSGRQVKELVNGASLSTSGFFRWDGTTDRGSIARMGYFVVVFEVFDGNGRKNVLKETVVVGRNF